MFAIKKIKISQMDKKNIQNTLNEIRILCSMENPFVCGYEEAFLENNGKALCIVMEYVGGGDM